ncbi:hypothetical protein I302_108910 [Kwoniella bestiolae CBS 10118]|uniref:Uncharacterized protein n=1 Tax=Kwoniella bestiolae CBS 10118 TaxID=1296100 RepID=A0A1B9FUF7_9TREE|nr:hypothetical protein I302_08050 [Kwoniella bestiolae CBS 10118]OCF22402.1 hypothetical protein I302_08050 [Kwoniella bestiolae CBS 10118]
MYPGYPGYGASATPQEAHNAHWNQRSNANMHANRPGHEGYRWNSSTQRKRQDAFNQQSTSIQEGWAEEVIKRFDAGHSDVPPFFSDGYRDNQQVDAISYLLIGAPSDTGALEEDIQGHKTGKNGFEDSRVPFDYLIRGFDPSRPPRNDWRIL